MIQECCPVDRDAIKVQARISIILRNIFKSNFFYRSNMVSCVKDVHFTEIFKIMLPYEILWSIFYFINIHVIFHKKILINSAFTVVSGVKIGRSFSLSHYSDIIRKDRIQHFNIVKRIKLIWRIHWYTSSKIEWDYVSESAHTLVSPTWSRIINIIYILYQTSLLKCIKEIILHRVCGGIPLSRGFLQARVIDSDVREFKSISLLLEITKELIYFILTGDQFFLSWYIKFFLQFIVFL